MVNEDHKQKTFTSGWGNLQDWKLHVILQLGTVSGHYALLTQQWKLRRAKVRLFKLALYTWHMAVRWPSAGPHRFHLSTSSSTPPAILYACLHSFIVEAFTSFTVWKYDSFFFFFWQAASTQNFQSPTAIAEARVLQNLSYQGTRLQAAKQKPSPPKKQSSIILQLFPQRHKAVTRNNFSVPGSERAAPK